MILAHLPLVDGLAAAYCRHNRFVELEDMVAAGRLGLCEAAETYDPKRGAFATYARHRVLGAMADEAALFGTLPRHAKARGVEPASFVPLDQVEASVTMDEEINARESLRRLRDLPEREKNIALDKINGYSQREIAEDLGLSQGRISQIVTSLRQQLS